MSFGLRDRFVANPADPRGTERGWEISEEPTCTEGMVARAGEASPHVIRKPTRTSRRKSPCEERIRMRVGRVRPHRLPPLLYETMHQKKHLDPGEAES